MSRPRTRAVDARPAGTLLRVSDAGPRLPSFPAIAARARKSHVASDPSATRAETVAVWIDAHLGERITLERLCEVAGAGGRSLQKLFRARYDASPMRFVLNRRLAAARAMLLEPESGWSVTSVAHDCGFTHMGRFSNLYRQSYGESPSETLLRNAGVCQEWFGGRSAGTALHSGMKGLIR